MHDHVADWVRALRRGPLLPAGEGVSVAVEGSSLLPHRPPMLLIDTVCAVDAKRGRVRARRRIADDDPVFAGHFPGSPIYPGVLLIETMAQAALAALPLVRAGEGAVPPAGAAAGARFTRVRAAAFLAPIVPGDLLEVHAEAIDDGLVIVALGQIWRGGTLAAYSVSEAQVDA